MNEFLDVSIEGIDGVVRKFRIRPVTAQVASWIVMQMEAGLFPREDVFTKVQAYFFEACSYFKSVEGQADLEVALFERPSRWLLAGMDSVIVDELFQEAMKFNLGPIGKRRDAKRKKLKEEEEARLAALVIPPPASRQT